MKTHKMNKSHQSLPNTIIIHRTAELRGSENLFVFYKYIHIRYRVCTLKKSDVVSEASDKFK